MVALLFRLVCMLRSESSCTVAAFVGDNYNDERDKKYEHIRYTYTINREDADGDDNGIERNNNFSFTRTII